MKLHKYGFLTAVLLTMALVFSCATAGGGGAGVGAWTFEDPAAGTGGWELANAEFYQYHGTIALSRDDTTFGKGLLRLDVDFSKDGGSEWSEPKMKNDFPRSFNMKGITMFSFDFYYNPSLHSPDGNFKSKVYSNSNGIRVDSTGEAIEGGEDAGNGFVKVPVSILIMPTAGFMTDLRFSIAGYMTTYTGPVFFDNMRWE
jgi:hypothetical protein